MQFSLDGKRRCKWQFIDVRTVVFLINYLAPEQLVTDTYVVKTIAKSRSACYKTK